MCGVDVRDGLPGTAVFFSWCGLEHGKDGAVDVSGKPAFVEIDVSR